jgi:hypothetical protein
VWFLRCSRSTSGMTCGTSPWSAVTRSSSTSPPAAKVRIWSHFLLRLLANNGAVVSLGFPMAWRCGENYRVWARLGAGGRLN